MAKDGKKLAVGALFAGVAGFLAGILTAPKSGKETREDIKTGAVKAKSEAEKMLKEAHSELNEKIAEAQTKANNLKGKAKKELEEALGKAKDTKEKVRTVISSVHEGDAEDPELKKAVKEAKAALTHLQKYLKTPAKK